jgi:hypothetical protein
MELGASPLLLEKVVIVMRYQEDLVRDGVLLYELFVSRSGGGEFKLFVKGERGLFEGAHGRLCPLCYGLTLH